MIPLSPPTAPDSRPPIGRRIGSPTGLAVTALMCITLAFYHGLWLPGLVLIKRDAFRFYLPLKQHLIERLSAGELPQWFPYEGLGRPFIGVAHTGVFHPFTALYFLLPVPDAYRASTLLSCLLAAVGAYALGRTLGFSRAGALVAGLAFTLSGYVVSLTDNLLYLYSICLLPFFCVALEKALVSSRPWVIAPAALWATVFLNGDVQTGYYYIFIALAWMLARAPGSYWEAGRRLALVGLLAALLAGIQLGPSWVVFAGSDRSDPALFLGQALHWSTHPLRLWTILATPVFEKTTLTEAANFFMGAQPIGSGVAGGLWAESLYLGVSVTGLALLGAWCRRDLKMLALLGMIALILSLGRDGGLYTLFYHVVPLWSAFRYPEKLMGVASFATAMLAGAGFDALRMNKGHSLYWIVGAIICAGVGVGLRTEAVGSWVTAHYSAPQSVAREVTELGGLAFLYNAAVALGMGLVATLSKKGSLRPEWLLTLVVALMVLDLARANLSAYHTGPVEAAVFVPVLAQAIATREGTQSPGRFRLFSIPEEKTVVPEPLARQLGGEAAGSVERRQALDMEHNAQFHLESLNVYMASRSSAFRDILQMKLGVAGAARYNVAYYIGRWGRVKDPQFVNTIIAELPGFGLALFKSSVPVTPRAYLSLRPERAAAPVDPAILIARPDFRSGVVDVVETSAMALPAPAAGGRAEITRYASEEVHVQIETPQAAVLVLLDAFDKGWTATLETGAEIPILRANALVRAVVVPAGSHAVTFSYQTPLLKVGAWASLAGVLLCTGLLVPTRRRTHHRNARA